MEEQGYYEAMRPEEYPPSPWWVPGIFVFGAFAVWIIAIFACR